MMEDDMKRNGSGYYDETPVKSGVLSGPQAGEIWETRMGKPYLILKSNKTFCTVLALQDEKRDDNIEVMGRSIMYTNPALVCYCFNTAWCEYIKTVPEEKYLDIMQAVGERLGVTIKVSNEADGGSAPNYKGMCEELRHQLEEARREVECVADERHALQEELRECREEMVLRRDFREEYEKAEAKATLWEKMYNALLDRLFARGEAK